MPDFFATAPQHLFFDCATHGAPRDEVASRSIGLLDEGVSNETILDAVIKHPLLVNRPIVYTPKGVRLCRPSEMVFDQLDRFPPGPPAQGTP